MSFTDAAEVVLHKSITYPNKEKNEIDYSYEFIEDFQDPQEEWYYHLASLFTHRQPPLEYNIDGLPPENNMAMDSVVINNLTQDQSAIQTNSTLNHDYSISTHNKPTQNNNWGPKKFRKKNHVIKLMV